MTVLQERFRLLLQRYVDGVCTPDEFTELLDFLQLEIDTPGMANVLDRALQLADHHPAESEVDWEKMRLAILEETPPALPVKRLFTFARAAAAIFILALLGTAAYWALYQKPRSPQGSFEQRLSQKDLAPGSNRAILTLANGRKIILDSAHNGNLAKEGNASVVKTDSGRLTYEATAAVGRQQGISQVLFNTLSTPRGGQYQLTLPDGTRVWLNAASSITYPTEFSGKTREVTVTGEAYFEVAGKPEKPFRVTVPGQSITVLGTAFNVNAYADEPISRTTVANGSVKVTVDSVDRILTAGQQTQVNGKEIRVIRNADLEQALAWKNGIFNLGGAGIREIMRQVSRWYDVDIRFEGNLDQAVFSGIVSRKENVSKLLEVLQTTGSIHFIIQDKLIIVKPN